VILFLFRIQDIDSSNRKYSTQAPHDATLLLALSLKHNLNRPIPISNTPDAMPCHAMLSRRNSLQNPPNMMRNNSKMSPPHTTKRRRSADENQNREPVEHIHRGNAVLHNHPLLIGAFCGFSFFCLMSV